MYYDKNKQINKAYNIKHYNKSSYRLLIKKNNHKKKNIFKIEKQGMRLSSSADWTKLFAAGRRR